MKNESSNERINSRQIEYTSSKMKRRILKYWSNAIKIKTILVPKEENTKDMKRSKLQKIK